MSSCSWRVVSQKEQSLSIKEFAALEGDQEQYADGTGD